MKLALCLGLVLWSGAEGVAAAPLEIYGDSYPPFLLERQGSLTGPYADAFALLARRQGLNPHFVALPAKRVAQTVSHTPNSCALAVNFSPGEAETLIFVGRVAPISISVYALRGKPPSLVNIEDLRPYSVGAPDIAEIRDLFGSANIRYEALQQPEKGLKMLQAGRFDLLVSDLRPELMAPDAASGVVRVFTLARVERWLMCQPRLSPSTLAALRRALQEGVFAESTRPVWQRYGLGAYFDEVRRSWSATGLRTR